jgi:hypothetical protein
LRDEGDEPACLAAGPADRSVRDARVSTSSTAWLFTRGRQSVRLVRREGPDGRIELVVQGPGAEGRTQVFATVPECMQHQSEVERALMAEGFTLRHAPERRREADRRRLTRSERRRPQD